MATLAFTLAVRAADLVGEWSDVARIEFSGLNTFRADDLRKALRRHAPFLLASHPLAPRAGLTPAIEQHVRAGYLAAGFPDVAVRAQLDATAARIRVSVTEGRRYRCGAVRVTGAAALPVAEVIRRLTTAWPPDATAAPLADASGALELFGTKYLDSAGQEVAKIDAIWTAGAPVDFSPQHLARLHERVRQVIADCGHYAANSTVKLARQPAGGEAQLQIDILGEGPPGRLGRITVEGLKRNSPESVLRWLGLERGQPVTPDLVSRLERQLWNSARFASYNVTAAPTGTTGELDLTLRLTEIAHGPLLDGEFSPVEQAVLKFREWLLATVSLAREGTPDFVMPASLWSNLPAAIGELELTLGPGGLLVLLRKDAAVRSALLLSAKRRMFFSAGTGQKLESAQPGGTFNLFASFLPEADAGSGKRTGLTFGVSWSSLAAEGSGAPVKLNLLIAPAACIEIVHTSDLSFRLAGGRLTIGDEEKGLHVDAATGRILGFGGAGPDERQAVRVEHGALDRMLREVDAAASATPNLLSAGRTASTLLRVLGAELIAGPYLQRAIGEAVTPAQRARAAAAFGKLCAQQPLAALDAAWAREKPADVFHIPLDQPAAGAGLGPLASVLLPLAEELLPARAWPAELLRELLLATSGEAPYLAATVERLANSPTSGPLALWMAARLLETIHSPSAHVLAQRGLQRLSAEDFQRDCRVLFDGNSGLAAAVQALARGLRDLPADDLDALAALFHADTAMKARQAWSALRERPGEPVAVALQPLLDALWEHYLRGKVEPALRETAGAAANAAEAERLFQEGAKPFNTPSGTPADRQAGARLIRQAAELGHVRAAFSLAQLHALGEGVARDPAASLQWHRRAAERGIIESQLALGNAYQLGLDVAADPVEACFWYALAAAGGHKPAESLRIVAQRKLTAAQIAAVERRLKDLTTGTPPIQAGAPK